MRLRVSRSTDDLAWLVPRNVKLTVRAPSSLRMSGSRLDAMPTSRIARAYAAAGYHDLDREGCGRTS